MIILGIDPGLSKTGWGLISHEKSVLKFIASGTIKTSDKENTCARLGKISEELKKIISEYDPDSAAVEETFVNKNARSSLALGQARGAAILTLAQCKLEVAEYAANLVKKTVTGNGHAEKDQIAVMVKMLLPGAKADSADAADALAVAICHSSHC
jgi:crossover junction endodeoxyribonuclease RuvC